ncbi:MULTISPECIES: sulfotransferase [unclassified Lentimicrobium]|uniref:sulfotransferase family protein n=1 Tax=unclassified Lentimicrobium TaxID=2677434 RepID=UPI0015533C9B|nr:MULTISPECIES: sulfotransferase [unclassified Lentimicrobium]NPD45562.1 hypothetical protein [Lentimicrobium sp. S6]NPD83641.1 hypothetical protein [Lentimicrobium sp. L6]
MEKQTKLNKPNFFILGAAKSGTSTLYYYLMQHPQIFLSKEKEPTFFCEDFQLIKNTVEYFKLFDQVEKETIIGEASHAYFTDPESPRIIHALFPKAKFLLILRNPVERAHSLFHFMRRVGLEETKTFEKAIHLEEERYHSVKFRKENKQYPYNYFYFRSGLFGEQLNRYFSLFEKSQFHIITMNELQMDFQGVMNKIFNFLKVDIIPSQSGKIINQGYAIKYVNLQKAMYKTQKYSKSISQQIMGFNKFEIPEIQEDTYNTLIKRYHKDQELLEELCGIRFL